MMRRHLHEELEQEQAAGGGTGVFGKASSAGPAACPADEAEGIPHHLPQAAQASGGSLPSASTPLSPADRESKGKVEPFIFTLSYDPKATKTRASGLSSS